MAIIEIVEQGARDVLNAGIGAFHTVTGGIEQAQKDINETYESLVSKGAAEDSELITSIRSGLDKGLETFKDVQTKVASTLNLN